MTNNNNTSNFTLNQNVPNPVVGNTKISFNLKTENTVKVVLSDKLGNKVKDIFEGKLSAGDHEVDLNVTGLNREIIIIAYLLAVKFNPNS